MKGIEGERVKGIKRDIVKGGRIERDRVSVGNITRKCGHEKVTYYIMTIHDVYYRDTAYLKISFPLPNENAFYLNLLK